MTAGPLAAEAGRKVDSKRASKNKRFMAHNIVAKGELTPPRFNPESSRSQEAAVGPRKVASAPLPVAPVEGLFSRRMVRCVDDVDDLRCDPAHHDLDPLAQRHLRGRASLASATHGDKQSSIADVNDRNLSPVSRDGTVDFPVQQFLNDRPNLSVDSPARTGIVRSLENC